MSPIENQAAWQIHRATVDAARSHGVHWSCATEMGFLAVEDAMPELKGEFGARPCAQCVGIWEAAKKRQREGKAA